VSFPKRLLIEGERLVLDLRPHWIALAQPVLVTVIAVVAVTLAFVYAPNRGTGRAVMTWGAVILAAGVFVIFAVPKLVRWATSHFVVTSDRLIHREGWVAKRSMEIPLEAINDVRFEQGVFERMIGAGDLIIESAGERGRQAFSEIRRPEEVQRIIYEQGELNRQRMAGGGSFNPQSPGTSSAGAELARLADLRDRGVLTEEEFQLEKRRILGQ
jgi:membrane protein YdbS with pleckstrin-like domain